MKRGCSTSLSGDPLHTMIRIAKIMSTSPVKSLLLGNAAVARGLYESGVTFVSSYPGTPSTEITEYAAEYPEIYAEWAPNEKVALEAVIGASIGGTRAFAGMKHVGLNVAADPLFICAYIGVSGGLVIAVADDSGMHSSQNEQDSRHYAIASKLPMLEPSDSAECLEYTKKAFEFSEKFDTPVLLRLSTRVSHSQSLTELSDRADVALKPYVKNAGKRVMMPANARVQHEVVEKRLAAIGAYANDCEFNRAEYHDTSVGIVTSGIAYQYAKEAFGDSASYLKLGLINPLPDNLLKDFASKVERVIVAEELDDVIETHMRKLGIKVDGKNILSFLGEYSQEILRSKILGQDADFIEADKSTVIPVRPPVLCAGCPHRAIFRTLKKLKVIVSGDIGCYTLGAVAPLDAMDTTLCMGASISALHGFNKAVVGSSHKSVAVIGDSTFMHSGITGLVDIIYNKGNSKVIILDNSITGMTGHQDNPTTGKTLKGESTPVVSLEKLAEALGFDTPRIFDPCDITTAEQIISEELAKDAPSVMISRRPCVLLKGVKRGRPFTVSDCKGCKACMTVGCPAISMNGKQAKIDPAVCTGCTLCKKLCKFGAISEVEA
ncbi:indolepyruvate oxidoreductase subunit IorA [Clostridia bacterium]|nr:indolepyruvate oxidoreductase subunit IorA [Clostridia bacterium]